MKRKELVKKRKFKGPPREGNFRKGESPVRVRLTDYGFQLFTKLV